MGDKQREKKIARELEDFYELNKPVSKEKHRHYKLEILEKFLKK